MRYSLVVRASVLWMRSSLASDCQCRSRNSHGFDPNILRHSGIWGAADEAVYRKKYKNPPVLKNLTLKRKLAYRSTSYKLSQIWEIANKDGGGLHLDVWPGGEQRRPGAVVPLQQRHTLRGGGGGGGGPGHSSDGRPAQYRQSSTRPAMVWQKNYDFFLCLYRVEIVSVLNFLF